MLFALCSSLFALCSLLHALRSLLSALCSSLFALCSLLSALRSLLSAPVEICSSRRISRGKSLPFAHFSIINLLKNAFVVQRGLASPGASAGVNGQ
jgi:hypothetical protein